MGIVYFKDEVSHDNIVLGIIPYDYLATGGLTENIAGNSIAREEIRPVLGIGKEEIDRHGSTQNAAHLNFVPAYGRLDGFDYGLRLGEEGGEEEESGYGVIDTFHTVFIFIYLNIICRGCCFCDRYVDVVLMIIHFIHRRLAIGLLDFQVINLHEAIDL
jgi:hypothetical protein